MKLLGLACLSIALAVAFAENGNVHHNGQPGCQTEEELRVQKYRNNWDPTAYWVCSVKSRAAIQQRCPPSLLFQDSEKQCIPAAEWNWSYPEEPPSRP